MSEELNVMAPLKDIRVLGVTVYLAGPFMMMNLARLGAEAIKVEVPGMGDHTRTSGPFATPDGLTDTQETENHVSTRFLKRGQGLKSVTLNLKDPEGRDMFLKMAENSDVVVENIAPGAMARLGLGFEEVSVVNPSIVYASISGYGQTGPYAAKRAHDPQIQGMSGLMDINGAAEGPPTRVGFYIADLVTPLFGCYSILAALRERDRTGQGQYIDVSMIDTLTSLIFMDTVEEELEAGISLRQGNDVRGAGATGLYHTKDGDIIVTVASNDQWNKLVKALDVDSLSNNPRFTTLVERNRHVDEVKKSLQSIFNEYQREDAISLLEDNGVPCAAVRGVEEVMEDEHFWKRGSLLPLFNAAYKDPIPGFVASGFPARFSGGDLPRSKGAPTLGMNNNDVYGELLNLGNDELASLKEKGII